MRRQSSPAGCVDTNAKDWAGSIFSSASVSAGVWRMTWDLEKRFRSWHFSNRAANFARADKMTLYTRRSWSCPVRWCFTGRRRRGNSHRSCAFWITREQGVSKPASILPPTTWWLTTYGTLRRDALRFKDLRFDYCILDEAQAIKNAGTLSAKAARLLRADHRLALSGTPVENHLGELWSLFEFLNPGMLGSAAIFGRAGRNPDAATRSVLARALRPFILRRTKAEVARELPPKTEQTIYCHLEPRDRKLYDELRDYYRSRLLKNVAQNGLSQEVSGA